MAKVLLFDWLSLNECVQLIIEHGIPEEVARAALVRGLLDRSINSQGISEDLFDQTTPEAIEAELWRGCEIDWPASQFKRKVKSGERISQGKRAYSSRTYAIEEIQIDRIRLSRWLRTLSRQTQSQATADTTKETFALDDDAAEQKSKKDKILAYLFARVQDGKLWSLTHDQDGTVNRNPLYKFAAKHVGDDDPQYATEVLGKIIKQIYPGEEAKPGKKSSKI